MISNTDKNALIANAELIYTKYIVLDVIRSKAFCKITTENNKFYTLQDICLKLLSSENLKISITIAEKTFDLCKDKSTNNIVLRRATLGKIITKQFSDYTEDDFADLLPNQNLCFEHVENGKWVFGILLPDGSVLGGRDKLPLYRTHLVALYNIIERIRENKNVDKKALLAALPTGSGKTFLQALWLHILHISKLTAIFTMPPNLIAQFCKDMRRLLPDSVVDKIIVLENGSDKYLTKAIGEGHLSIVTSSDNFLDNCFHAEELHDGKRTIFLSFDEQHKTEEIERHKVRREMLAKQHVSLYLTATPSKMTYVACDENPVAMMSPEQKQKSGQGRLGLIKTIETKFDVDLNRKYMPLKRYKDFFLIEIASVATGFMFPPVSSASREAVAYLPYQISYQPGANKRYDVHMAIQSKMLFLIDDNESLVNFFNSLNLSSTWYSQPNMIYHNGALQRIDPAQMNRNFKPGFKDIESLNEMYKRDLFDSQTSGMNEFDKDNYRKIADQGLIRQVRANMFHYLVEYVLMDITGLTQIELNELRKIDLQKLKKIVETYYKNNFAQTNSYFFQKLYPRVGNCAAKDIAELLTSIAQYIKSIYGRQNLEEFCENWFLNNELYECIVKFNSYFLYIFNQYANKYQVVAVMANMQDADMPIVDSKPFNLLIHKSEIVSANKNKGEIKAKKRQRGSMEQIESLMGNAYDDYFSPQYFPEDITEEQIDALFDLGMIGIYVSNKKAVGANFLSLQTVVSINENALSKNANPSVKVQSYGRLRGLDSTMQPMFINVFGRKVKEHFDLNLLAKKGDYYPKYFKSQKAYNKKYIKVLGESLAKDIIKTYYESSDKSGIADYSLIKLETLKLIVKGSRELNINNNFDADLSKAHLAEAIIYATASLDKEIYEVKHPYSIGWGTRALFGTINGFFSAYNFLQNSKINLNLRKHAKNLTTSSAKNYYDRIYLKIINSNVTLPTIFAAQLTFAEFALWAGRIKETFLIKPENKSIRDISDIYTEYTQTEDKDKLIIKLANLLPDVLNNFDSIINEIFKSFSPILFHPEMLKNLELLIADLSKEDVFYMYKSILVDETNRNIKIIIDDICTTSQKYYSLLSSHKTLGSNYTKMLVDEQNKLKNYKESLVKIYKDNNNSTSDTEILEEIDKLVQLHKSECVNLPETSAQIENSRNKLVDLCGINNSASLDAKILKSIDTFLEIIDIIRKKDAKSLISSIKNIFFDLLPPLISILIKPLTSRVNPENLEVIKELLLILQTPPGPMQQANIMCAVPRLLQILQLTEVSNNYPIDEFKKTDAFFNLSTLFTIPNLIIFTKINWLCFYNNCDLNFGKLSTKDEIFIKYLSEPLTSDEYRRPYREIALKTLQITGTLSATKRLANIKLSANSDTVENLEKINENILKSVWWKLKVSIWRQSLMRLLKNIYYGFKFCLLYVWSGIKRITNYVIDLVYDHKQTNSDVSNELNDEQNIYPILDFTKKLNQVRPINYQDALDKSCPSDSLENILNEIEEKITSTTSMSR